MRGVEHDSAAVSETIAEVDGPSSEDSLRASIVSLRPGLHVEAERLEQTIARELFGTDSDPARIGRFVILGRLGSGGMGVVYSAYDPRLDRKVALKLLRDSSRVGEVERQRLIREAHALARISHPNVVTVHEVGELDEQVFVVMEFVVGRTLGEWVRGNVRSVSEVLDVYRQAGTGLVAAHAAGLVHRDFKPQNALIGDDGRVRVVDFGLACGDPEDSGSQHEERESAESATEHWSPAAMADRFEAALTRSDAILGTPAYMSPEQYMGRAVGPASDQFSFCIALHEALTGEHPFARGTPIALATRIVEGDIRSPRRTRVPSWLLAVLRRGMSVDPRERHRSMAALLESLARDPARTRRRWAVGAATLAAVGSLAFALANRPDQPAPCASSLQALGNVWGDARRNELEGHFGTLESSDVAAVGSRILDKIDDYAGRWQSAHHDACMAHHSGVQSGAMLDKRMACLARRRAAFESATEVLDSVVATSFDQAVVMVHQLPAIEPCSDLEGLEAEHVLPDDPSLAQEVLGIREGLASALTLNDAGRFEQAVAEVQRQELHARTLGYRPVLAEALLVRGKILMERGLDDPDYVSAMLLDAFHTGIAASSDAVAVEALIRRIFIEGIRTGDHGSAEEDRELIRSLLERMPRSLHLRALFLNNAGTIAASRQEYSVAREYFRQALELRQRGPESNPIELLGVRFNLALMSLDHASQVAGFELVLEGYAREFGPGNLRTLDVSSALAMTIRDPLVAEQRFGQLCDRYRERYPEHEDRINRCLLQRAMWLSELGRADDAAPIFERAAEREVVGARETQSSRVSRTVAEAFFLHHGGQSEQACDRLEGALRSIDASQVPAWMSIILIRARLVLGEMQVAAGRYEDAIASLRPTIESVELILSTRFNGEDGYRLARARIALAQALLHTSTPMSTEYTSEIEQLLESSAQWYRAGGPGVMWRLQQIEELRRDIAG